MNENLLEVVIILGIMGEGYIVRGITAHTWFVYFLNSFFFFKGI